MTKQTAPGLLHLFIIIIYYSVCWGLLVPEGNSHSACRKMLGKVAQMKRLTNRRGCALYLYVRSMTCMCISLHYQINSRLLFLFIKNYFNFAKTLWALWGESGQGEDSVGMTQAVVILSHPVTCPVSPSSFQPLSRAWSGTCSVSDLGEEAFSPGGWKRKNGLLGGDNA